MSKNDIWNNTDAQSRFNEQMRAAQNSSNAASDPLSGLRQPQALTLPSGKELEQLIYLGTNRPDILTHHQIKQLALIASQSQTKIAMPGNVCANG